MGDFERPHCKQQKGGGSKQWTKETVKSLRRVLCTMRAIYVRDAERGGAFYVTVKKL